MRTILKLRQSIIKDNRVEDRKEHTSELQSHSDLVCRLLLEKKKKKNNHHISYASVAIAHVVDTAVLRAETVS